MSAVAAFGAFMLLYDARERDAPADARCAFGAGLLAAATTLFEYPALPCSVVLTRVRGATCCGGAAACARRAYAAAGCCRR